MPIKLSAVSSDDYVASGMLPDELEVDNFRIRFLPWRYPPRSDGTVSEAEARNGRPYALFARIYADRRDGEEWRPINLRVAPLQYFVPCNLDDAGNPVLPAEESAYEALCTVDEAGEPLARIDVDANGQPLDAATLAQVEQSHEGTTFACVCDDAGNELRSSPDKTSGWAQFFRALETVTGRKVGDGQPHNIYDGLSLILSSVPSDNPKSKRPIHVPTAVLNAAVAAAPTAARTAPPAKPATPKRTAASSATAAPAAVPVAQPTPAPTPAAPSTATPEDVELVNSKVVEFLADTGGSAAKTTVILKTVRMFKEAGSSSASVVLSEMLQGGGGAEGWTLEGDTISLTPEMKEALGL